MISPAGWFLKLLPAELVANLEKELQIGKPRRFDPTEKSNRGLV